MRYTFGGWNGVDTTFDECCAIVDQLNKLLGTRYARMSELGYAEYHARMIYDPLIARDLLNVPYLDG